MDLFLQYKKNVSAMKDSFAVILNWEVSVANLHHKKILSFCIACLSTCLLH